MPRIYSTRIATYLAPLIVVGLFFCTAALAEAATLSVSPGTGVYTAGQTFTVRVVVNTAGANINAAEGTLSFKPEELSVVSVAKGSIFNLWTADPSFSNSAGTVTFSGGTPTGYTGRELPADGSCFFTVPACLIWMSLRAYRRCSWCIGRRDVLNDALRLWFT